MHIKTFESYHERKERLAEWVSTLQVGDEVALMTFGWARSRYYQIVEIVKVTPTGRRNLSNGMVVNPDGEIRGDRRGDIYPVSDEIKHHIWKEKCLSHISNKFDIHKLSDEQIKTVLEIMEEIEHREAKDEGKTLALHEKGL